MPKLTETTNDKNELPKRRGRPPKAIPPGNGKFHIVEAHEPLKDDLTGGLSEALANPIPPPLMPPVQYVSAPFVFNGMSNATPVVQPLPLKVALLGTAPSSRNLAPFNDLSWKIWACSPGNMNVLPRVDAWFEIHTNLMWPEHKHYGEPYVEWLKKQKFPIYMQDQSLVPHAIPFPKDELVKEFGRSFFTSSFAWMMAMAIKQGATEIALYGIDMASRDEYILQRPGFYFFQHMAETRGIKVSAPNESDIMMPPGLYGYSDGTPFGRKLHARRKEIKDRITQMEGEINRLRDNINYLKGADEDIDYWLSIWSGVQDNTPSGAL